MEAKMFPERAFFENTPLLWPELGIGSIAIPNDFQMIVIGDGYAKLHRTGLFYV